MPFSEERDFLSLLYNIYRGTITVSVAGDQIFKKEARVPVTTGTRVAWCGSDGQEECLPSVFLSFFDLLSAAVSLSSSAAGV